MSHPSVSPYSSLIGGQLSEHVQKCLMASGPMHRLHCTGEALHGFLAGRFVTTMVVVTALVALTL